ncbi:CDP-diacylglycerol--glycerol-3-phosphate 3-phosphatidyltransferase [Proteiniborus ethanoligenes]|uniref:CDP-diacylglycerol--glycerol-3-phosphate 3-phosphatidyltransferase n=1 Tax=Proteiniborus ethanoligenes TaxID=415015 RepID=A0A1H3P9J3_9FIRM|nr:CDP-diacylglycerol--glycerol-3-phosphate 3-phosphatidyltransferase [Proteiniborus ethanoligenes]TAH63978.1 MAG: CDP-diacylglycerol--glycerol-3-phosphate 3-phosphatidyltransferase [Gottschalkiaceae bacterium]SDY97786.1 CDP-diacylglycerol--glycerol-3-phosphate 3-phosphatidyltransferase [Proteiniborus ethanoligenes]
MNIPNVLTTIRFLLVPIFVFIFYSSIENNILYATIVFAIAGVTDVLDGYIARTYNMVTKWGVAMDPLADKLMQLTVLICFTSKAYLPIWVIIVVGLKEILMVIGALFLYYSFEKTVIPANRYGKIATIAFYIAILSIAFNFPETLSFILVLLAVMLTLLAFINYFLGFKEVRKDNKNIKSY